MNFKNLAFWLMIIGIFALGIYLVFYIKGESFQCMNNPYIYSIRLLEKANDAEVSCICTAYKDYGSASVLLTKDGFKEMENSVGKTNNFNISFNFSKIEVNKA